MNDSRKAFAMKYGISVGICVLMVYLYFIGQVSGLDDFLALALHERYRILCDAFTIPGVLFLMTGCLVALSNAGALDAVGYIFHFLVTVFRPGRERRVEKYYDYVQEKKEKRTKGYGFLFVVGGIFMAVSLLFLVLFYCVYS